ncbi:aldose epimerase family protein [Pedobacter sp. UYP30]|uniref:aldose epimerase family protein n=1 Tax=Pedobacter sp. UYP30 TaxID=1756400 RepID=UPI003395342B
MKKIVRSFFFLFLVLLTTSTFSKSLHRKHKGRFQAVKPTISKALFGELDGQKIYKYTLKNSRGMLVKVINYGAAIIDIETPDRNGEMGSVVLGFDSLKSYTGKQNQLLGSAVGRVANRIFNGKFTLDGREFQLTSNIHGGKLGFDRKIWNIEEVPGKKQVALKVTYFSKDGEEGFPGNLHVTITYTLTNDNQLSIDYAATTDKATPVVLTNHSYFNLSGGKNDKVLNTELSINADKYLQADKDAMPSGKLLDVKGTPYDFTSAKQIGRDILKNDEQLIFGQGYDLTFALRNKTGKLALAASAFEPLSGRTLQVYTTEPGLVFYTANYLNEKIIGRGGKPLAKNGAFCLETQHYPDSPNKPEFPNTILRPGEKFSSQTVFKFGVRK